MSVVLFLHQHGVTHAVAYHKVVGLGNGGGKIVIGGEPEGVGGGVNGWWSEAREDRERGTNDAEDGREGAVSSRAAAVVVVIGDGVDGEFSCSEHALIGDAVAVSEVVEGRAKSCDEAPHDDDDDDDNEGNWRIKLMGFWRGTNLI